MIYLATDPAVADEEADHSFPPVGLQSLPSGLLGSPPSSRGKSFDWIVGLSLRNGSGEAVSGCLYHILFPVIDKWAEHIEFIKRTGFLARIHILDNWDWRERHNVDLVSVHIHNPSLCGQRRQAPPQRRRSASSGCPESLPWVQGLAG